MMCRRVVGTYFSLNTHLIPSIYTYIDSIALLIHGNHYCLRKDASFGMNVYSRAPEFAERVQIRLSQEINNQYNHPFPTSYSSYKCVSIELLLMNSFHSSQNILRHPLQAKISPITIKVQLRLPCRCL